MRPQMGIGLVELMVSLVLGLMLVGGALSIFLSSWQVFRTNESLSRIQENARVAFEWMARELRAAGGNPCGARVMGNTVNGNTTAWGLNWAAGTLIGASGTQPLASVAFGTAAASRVAATDAIQLLSGNLEEPVGLLSDDPTTAALNLATTTNAFKPGAVVVACDARSAAITQITGVAGASLFHAAGVGSPGNCSAGLGVPTDCVTARHKAFEPGGFVSPLTAVVWYVGNNGRGTSSLYRKVPSPGSPEEIAEGVSHMAIDYLLRDEASGEPDQDWIPASAVTDWSPTAPRPVVAVRIALSLVGAGHTGTDAQALRRRLVYAVNLRNRSR